MRRLLIVPLIAGLAACQTVRSGLGAAQAAIDKGIGVNLPTDQSTAAASRAADPTRAALPGALIGDTEHRAYSATPPR